MENNILLSIVIPCLNEEKTIGQCISIAKNGVSDLGISAEIIVADNGSTDNSTAIATGLGARTVSIPQKGYGAALMGGIMAANGKYIIMGDGDLSYDFTANSLRPFLTDLEKGIQIVIGNRYAGGIKKGAMPSLHKYFGTPFMSFAINLLFGTKFKDINCGLRAFTKKDILSLNLNSSGMEFASEMIIRAKQENLTMSEVPTTLSPDGRDRKPHLRSFRDGFKHMRIWLKLLGKKNAN